ncbi:SpoIIE family protein phosphatase [Streptomyces sp. NPDC048577]|uniref:SpoIIE family protein phosphatase n=1 Tax=Streptomyces sp. NPDC048577 TaxID=3157209 RepID=UPI00343D2060
MDAADAHRTVRPSGPLASAAPGGLLDMLGVAAIVLDAGGRITLWSPQAERLFGWTADEALGRYAARLLVAEEDAALVLDLFAQVMTGGGSWAGVFPVRHKDGSSRPVEFRNMRLTDQAGGRYALGIAADEEVVRGIERNLALSAQLVAQSPTGVAVADTDLRLVLVNPSFERITGCSAQGVLGREAAENLPFGERETVEETMREVLATGTPRLDRFATERARDGQNGNRACRVSYYRLEDSVGRVIGVVATVLDVTEQYHADRQSAHARRRLAVIAQASTRIGTTLNLEQTARELADTVVPDLADIAAVDVLDAALHPRTLHRAPTARTAFRALAVKAAYATTATDAADPIGEITRYEADRLVTRCATTGRTVHLARVRPDDLPRIARDDTAATLLADAGVHSYLAVPLIARGEVLGALDLKRARNPMPFTTDDILLAEELAARAAVCIDNARWYQTQLQAATTLQRHLLSRTPPDPPGLKVACRYQPAGTAGHAGGDWFDVIPLTDGTTALVVGDVMGSGINAAATMGQLRTATRTLTRLGLAPDEILRHLDVLTGELDEMIATCVYARYDPGIGRCHIALAGHPPPALTRPGRPPLLLELPPGAPLGAAEDVPFTTTGIDLPPGARLFLYTDGLLESRHQSLDSRMDALLRHLTGTPQPLETTCDELIATLPDPDSDDDIALLIAEADTPDTPGPDTSGAPGVPGTPDAPMTV